MPSVPGSTMQEKKRYCAERLDWLRRVLTHEPRGSENSYGILVTSPASRGAHFGAVFMDQTGWHDMCGHASMGFASIAVRLGLVERREPVTEVVLDTPAGRVELRVRVEGGEVRSVSMVNVPSFVHSVKEVEVGGYGRLRVPVVFGGNFYGIVELRELGLRWSREALPELIRVAREVWAQIDGPDVAHPTVKGLRGVYGVRFVEKVRDEPYRAYGILIFGSRDRPLVDRSPSGTGTSAHLAYLHSRGELGVGAEAEFVSAVGTVFRGRVLGVTKVGPYEAVVPEVSTVDRGGYVTGYATWVVEEDDPLGEGFTL